MGYISAFDIDGDIREEFNIPEISECPICHYALKPTIIDSKYVNDSEEAETLFCNLYTTFFCPKCRGVFLGKFRFAHGVLLGDDPKYLNSCELFPMTPNRESFSDDILGLSLTFVETYGQAQQAEAEGLSQICGIGYRKALEYPVKDYLCHKFPTDEEAIKAEALGQSLRRIEDGRIKTVAQRATWIGNDETHYVRKHEDLDVKTMKTFIRAMINFIDSELTFEKALCIDPA